MDSWELKRLRAGPSPTIADLTPDECRFLDAGGTIECQIENDRWVKRRVGSPPSYKALAPGRRRPRGRRDLELARWKIAILELGL